MWCGVYSKEFNMVRDWLPVGDKVNYHVPTETRPVERCIKVNRKRVREDPEKERKRVPSRGRDLHLGWGWEAFKAPRTPHLLSWRIRCRTWTPSLYKTPCNKLLSLSSSVSHSIISPRLQRYIQTYMYPLPLLVVNFLSIELIRGSWWRIRSKTAERSRVWLSLSLLSFLDLSMH